MDQQTYPTTAADLAARCEALTNPIAIRILGALAYLPPEEQKRGSTSSLQKHFATCDGESEAGKLGVSYLLTKMCAAGILIDLTPEKKKWKEYAINHNDGFTWWLAGLARYITQGK